MRSLTINSAMNPLSSKVVSTFVLAVTLLLVTAICVPDLYAGSPCCSITGISTSTGMVTATENATGKSFQFKVNNARLLNSLQVGQAVYANFGANQVSLDGRSSAGSILNLGAAPASAPSRGYGSYGPVNNLPPDGAVNPSASSAAPHTGATTARPSIPPDGAVNPGTAGTSAAAPTYTAAPAYAPSRGYGSYGPVNSLPPDGAVNPSASSAAPHAGATTAHPFQPIDGAVNPGVNPSTSRTGATTARPSIPPDGAVNPGVTPSTSRTGATAAHPNVPPDGAVNPGTAATPAAAPTYTAAPAYGAAAPAYAPAPGYSGYGAVNSGATVSSGTVRDRKTKKPTSTTQKTADDTESLTLVHEGARRTKATAAPGGAAKAGTTPAVADTGTTALAPNPAGGQPGGTSAGVSKGYTPPGGKNSNPGALPHLPIACQQCMNACRSAASDAVNMNKQTTGESPKLTDASNPDAIPSENPNFNSAYDDCMQTNCSVDCKQ